MKTTMLRSIAHRNSYVALSVLGILLMNYLLIGRINTCLNYMSDNETLIINEITNDVVDVGDAKSASLTTIKKKSKKVKKSNVVVSQNKLSSNKNSKGIYDSSLGSQIVQYALQFEGLRYVYGGNSLKTGTDCSGFVKLIYAHFGYNLKRGARGQLSNGRAVSKSELQPGDLIFYNEGGTKVTHVALYIGNGKIIHETTPKSGCKIQSMNCMHYVTARRIIKDVVTTTAQTTTFETTSTTLSTTVETTTSTITTTTTTSTTTAIPQE